MEHRNIPNDGLHEPKDVVFATSGQVYVADGNGSGSWGNIPPVGIGTALSGQVYVANGVGGGNWTFPSGGWAVYDDTGTAFVVAATPSDLTIDGLGPNTNENNIPQTSAGPLWSDNSFSPISPQDVYGIELTLDISSVVGATSLTVSLGSWSVTVPAQEGVIRLSDPFHVFGNEVEVGVEIVLSTDAGTVNIANRSVKIVQLYGA